MTDSRRGFTLIELLVTVVILSLVAASVGQVLVRSFRTSQAQLVQADMQSNVRTGGLIVPLEFREIGYDSNIVTGTVTSDIESIGTTAMQFRAMRGWASTCGTLSLNEIRIRKPVYGLRRPQLTDGFLWYVENDGNTGVDDQWVPLVVTAIDENSLCGADSAIALTMSTPEYSPGVNLALSQVFVGGPVRWYERMNFGSFFDADGRSYLGARSVSAGENEYRAVIGPLAAANGLRLRYYARNGSLLDPATANPASVRSVEVRLIGATTEDIALSGSATRQAAAMTTTTRVSLRNTLSH
ncbi:MAG TPA: type II secretion system protein [Gemmatimonadales bacterium]